MKIAWIGILLVLFCSASFKPKNKLQIEGQIIIHHPYCGGAQPTKEMEKGIDEPFANATFYVKSKLNNARYKKTVAVIKTDAEGKFQFRVKKPGTYYIVGAGKVQSLSGFIKQYNKPSEFLKYIGDEQAAVLYKQADAQIDIQSDNKSNIVIQAKCFSGINPLLVYTGPLPQ